MSQSSREYVMALLEFYRLCLSQGAVSVRKFEPTLLSIHAPGKIKIADRMQGNKGVTPPIVFQRPLSLDLKIDKKDKKGKIRHRHRAWIFPFTSRSIVSKLIKVVNMWNEYLVGIWTNGRRVKIRLTDHMGKCKFKVSFRMYTIKT